MAKQSEYENALGSIFDFVFAENEKAPNKRKPLKPTGVDASNELVDALSAAMAMPGVFVTNETMSAVNNLGDIKVYNSNLGLRASDGIGIKVSDIPDLLRDPSKFIDKRFGRVEAIRKAQRAAWAGEFMMGVSAGALARKAGLDMETQLAMTSAAHTGTSRGSVKSVNMLKKNEKLFKKYRGVSDDYLRKELGKYYSESKLDEKVGELSKSLKGFNKGYEAATLYADLKDDQLMAKLAENAQKKNGLPTTVKELNEYRLKGRRSTTKFYKEKGSYQLFEIVDLEGKSVKHNILAKKAKTEKEREEAEDKARKYRHMGNIIVTVNGMDSNNHGFQSIKEGIKVLKSRRKYIDDELKAGSLNRSDANRLRKERREIDESLNQLNRYQMGANLGNLEGIYGSVKDYVFEGNLVSAIVTGDFYDKNRNGIKFLLPSKEQKVKWERDRIGRNKGKKFEEETSYLVARKIRSDKGGARFMNNYYESMTELYYLSPVALAKSLFYDGSHFAYRRHKNAIKAQKKLLEQDTLKKFEGLIRQKLEGDLGDIENLAKHLGGLGSDEMRELFEKMNVDELLKDEFKDFFDKDERLTKLIKRHSSLGNLQKRVSKWFTDKAKPVREGVSKVFALLGLESSIIDSWVEGGGFYVMARGLIEEGFKKLLKISSASTLGPAAAWLLDKTIDLAVEAVSKLAKPLMKISFEGLKYAVMAILIMLVSVVFIIFSWTSPHANTAPDQVEFCENYAEYAIYGYHYEDIEPGGDDVIYDGTIQEIYAQVQAELGVSTGLELVNCPGHHACSLIDWAWCYSGAAIYCKADALAGQSATTLTRLFRHELLHQVQARGGGGAPSVIREWGADYLSQNGGGYWFYVGGKRIRATEAESYFLATRACTQSQLVSIARNEAGSLNTSCGSIVLNAVNFAPR